jgi:hypothetical protein
MKTIQVKIMSSLNCDHISQVIDTELCSKAAIDVQPIASPEGYCSYSMSTTDFNSVNEFSEFVQNSLSMLNIVSIT